MGKRMRRVVWPVVLVALFVGAVRVMRPQDSSEAVTEEYVRSHYTKHEYRIPMRDGVRLFTAVYVPKDRRVAYPMLLQRTPYSVAPYGANRYPTSLGPSGLFTRSGYIFVYQDVRGRLMSDGEFVDVRPQRPATHRPTDIDESTDTYDTIEWLLSHVPGHNGRVGLYGISYPGFYAAAGMIDAHPALAAVSPQAPIADWFVGDDFHHNGALYLPHAFSFLSGFGWPRPAPTTDGFTRFDFGTTDGMRFYTALGPLSNVDARYFHGKVRFWTDMMAHETYDAFWRARNLRPHLKAIRPAVLTVGGWFDAEDLFGALEVYKHTERQSPGARNMLVMGPWFHGGWSRSDGEALGDVAFGAPTARFYREHIELPFFEHVLKGGPDPKLPEAWVFETGSNRWRRLDAWPPRDAVRRSLYLDAGGRLSFTPPPQGVAAFDEYVSDPARPVPYAETIGTGMSRDYMVADQRFVAARSDVLVYQTEPLAEDLIVAGPIWPSLLVSTSGTDSDFVVKLIDVYPDGPVASKADAVGRKMAGYQQLLRGEVFRGKFRQGFDTPVPFEPNTPTRVEYVMPDVLHTFRRGHRIMVQIQSTWFPLVDRNPQRFVCIPTASQADFQPATERLYRGGARGSRIDVNVWPDRVEGRPGNR